MSESNIFPATIPWNKGLLVGQKKPLQPKHVWSIRARLDVSFQEVVLSGAACQKLEVWQLQSPADHPNGQPQVILGQHRHGEREIAKSQRDYLSDFIKSAC